MDVYASLIAGIKQQFSQPGKPWQNGRIERFFGTLKHELRSFKIEKVTDLQQAATSVTWFCAWGGQLRGYVLRC